KPLGQANPFSRNIEIHASRVGDSLAANQYRAIQLSEILDLLANFLVTQVAFRLAVAAKRIEVDGPRKGMDFACITHDEDRSDRVPLPSFAADFCRQVHHQPQRLQGNQRVELTKIACGEPLKVLVQMHDTYTIDWLGHTVLERHAVVKYDDVRARLKFL